MPSNSSVLRAGKAVWWGTSLALTIALSACPARALADSTPRRTPGFAAAGASERTGRALSSGKIDHVVIVIQENRSFNNLFMGFPGATTSTSGLLCSGASVPLHAVPLGTSYDVGHGLLDFLAAYDHGKGDCFNKERYFGNGAKPAFFAYGFVPKSQSAPYWAMANAYTLADKMFASNVDASFTAHQYLIAGQAQSSVDIPGVEPWGCDGPPSEMENTITEQRTFGPKQPPCFTYPTLATELDGAGLSWRYYAPSTNSTGGIWSAFDAIAQVREGSEWGTNVISPETRILADVASGKLANVTWVVPDLANSDHAEGGKNGPQWVSSVVDAVGTSKFWNSTAIFVIWDDWGGWYDPVPPVYVDYDGLGFRVPLIAISPYARAHHVAHTAYEFGSILKFVELNWGLGQLAPSDTRAATFGADVFNFQKQPAAFKPFGSPSEMQRFRNQRPSNQAPDDD